MYRVEINIETNKDVEINFQEGYDYIIDKGLEYNTSFRYLLDYFYDTINTFTQRFPKLSDCIDVLDDNRYNVSCETEEQAKEIENWFDKYMQNVESIVCDVIDEYEEVI